MQTARSNQLNTGRKGAHSIEAVYAQMWADDKIDKNRWAQFFCAAAAGATTEEHIAAASDLADLMYIQMMKREHGVMG